MSKLLIDELRFAIRRLCKDAGTTIASVAALACGIGAAVATWALVSAVLLRPLPIEGADRLFQVDEPPPPNVVEFWVPRYTYSVFESIRDSGAFEVIAASGALPAGPMPVIEQGDVPQRRSVHFAAYGFFATLGIGAALGRTFTQDEDRRGAVPVAVTDLRGTTLFGGTGWVVKKARATFSKGLEAREWTIEAVGEFHNGGTN